MDDNDEHDTIVMQYAPFLKASLIWIKDDSESIGIVLQSDISSRCNVDTMF